MPFVQEVAPYSNAHELLALNGTGLVAMIPKVRVRRAAQMRASLVTVCFLLHVCVGSRWSCSKVEAQFYVVEEELRW